MGPPRPADVVARDVSVTYPGRDAPAVAGVSFELPAGACLLVVGPSGSGKSTLARAVAGLVPWAVPARADGEIRIDGLSAFGAAGAAGVAGAAGAGPAGAPGAAAVLARTGIVFQDPASQLVMEHVEDDVAFGLEGRGWSREAMRARVPAVLAEAGLTGFERRRTGRLSGGEQQRLAVAGALAPLPGLLVLDEPTANLDPDGAAALADRLAAIRERRAATIVFVEHRAELAWPLADLVLALGRGGRPIALGAPNTLLRDRRQLLVEAGIWLPGEPVPALPARPAGGRDAGDARLVEAHDVSFAFETGRPVVRDASLSVAAGERVALIGPNGSGKSTFARLAVGLLRPAAGRVRLAGREPSRLPAADLARLAGYVVQDPERSFVAATVEAEIGAGLRPAERARAAELAEALGLPFASFGPRNPFTLSGGEQRRLSLAAQLVREPALLVLDEPTFGQDRHGYDRLLGILRSRVLAGTALLSVTHDLRFAAEMSDRVVCMVGGRLFEGPDR
jgi:energy-coupling factor transporter ATP-binding protein EcfA2